MKTHPQILMAALLVEPKPRKDPASLQAAVVRPHGESCSGRIAGLPRAGPTWPGQTPTAEDRHQDARHLAWVALTGWAPPDDRPHVGTS